MPSTLQQLFSLAIAAQQSGEFDKAREICTRVLEKRPREAVFWQLFGLIEQQDGHLQAAEKLMRQALELAPEIAESRMALAYVLIGQGRDADAADELMRCLALKPFASGYYALYNVLKRLGRMGEAGAALERALEINPDYPDALNSLGVIYFDACKLDQAVDCFERALAVNPDFPEALNNLGNVYYQTDRNAEAKTYYAKALALRPDYAAGLNNYGNILKIEEDWDGAVRAYERSIELDPNDPEPYNNLGVIFLRTMLDHGRAEALFRHVLTLNPRHAPAFTHLGVALWLQGAFEESLACHQKALELDPGCFDAYNNLGNSLKALRRFPEAIQAYRRYLTARPNDAEGTHNLSMALLSEGLYEEGWRLYGARWKTNQLAGGWKAFPQPLWEGQDAPGKTLLMHAEQGFGDTLQFCRYAPLAAARGFRVIVEAPAPLMRLLTSLDGVAELVACDSPLPPFDFHCPMMSLPVAFQTRVETIPAPTSYLAAPEDEVAAWRARLATEPEGLKVGLVWAGNARSFSPNLAAVDRRRSVAPELFAPLAKIEGVRFYSLQKDGPPAPDELGLIDHMAACADFAATAALIQNLDLVLSVDTAVAHLAAALGKPVWLLDRFDGCWRWLEGREDSPWYPTLSLFRQPAPGDWPSVIKRVAKELEKSLAAKTAKLHGI